MKTRIASALLLLAVTFTTACSAADPWPEDFYSRNIYPAGSSTYNIGSPSLPYEIVHTDNLTLGGAPLLIPAYAEIYADDFTVIECVVADTYYPVVGPTTEGEMLGFSSNDLGRITYTDVTADRISLIQTAMALSVPADDRPAIISSKLYKNGVSDNASYIGEYISDEDPADALPIMCLLLLEDTGDYIEVYIASNTANTTVVVNTLTLVATTVD